MEVKERMVEAVNVSRVGTVGFNDWCKAETEHLGTLEAG